MNTLQTTTSSFYTRFYPSLQSFTGSAFSTLIVGKLEYWFSIPKYVNGFYKFVEPCSHPLYREGDSWSEELGISRKLFAKAFDLIGVRYPSKSAFLKEEDPFKGKLYASYHDRSTNQTYYVRNHSFVADCLKGIFTKKKPSLSQDSQKKMKPDKKATYEAIARFQKDDAPQNEGNGQENVEKEREIPTEVEKGTAKTKTHLSPIMQQDVASPQNAPSFFLVKGRSWNGDLGRSYARASSFIQKNTSSLEGAVEKDSIAPYTLTAEEIKVTEGMIKIWNEEIGELGIKSVTSHLSKRLFEVLVGTFENSMSAWRIYCKTISSSKFLMGEAQNKFFKKAWITWAIKQENIERIRAGEFKLGDRPTNQDKEIDALTLEIQNVETKKRSIESQIATIRSEERERKRNIVKEKIKNLTNQEKQCLEQAFEAHLTQENNSLTEEFRKLRWKGLFISSYFEGFVEEKVFAELFKKGALENRESPDDIEEKLIQSSGYLETLDQTNYDLACLIEKKSQLTSSLSSFLKMEQLKAGPLQADGL